MSIAPTNIVNRDRHSIACLVDDCLEQVIKDAVVAKLNATVEETTWRERFADNMPWESQAELHTPEWVLIDIPSAGITTFDAVLRVKAGDHDEFQLSLSTLARTDERVLLVYDVDF